MSYPLTRLYFSIVLGFLFTASPALAQFIFTPTLDGANTEWSGQYQYLDADEDGTGGTTNIPNRGDIQTTYIGNDATYFYFGILFFANINNINDIFLDIDADNDGNWERTDPYIVLDLNNSENCTGLQVVFDDPDPATSTNVGCTGNYALSGNFVEVRTPLVDLGLSSTPNVSVVSSVRLNTGVVDFGPDNTGWWSTTPEIIPYDNTGAAVPTYISLAGTQVVSNGIANLIRWQTSAEYHSLGTEVLRKTGNSWVSVSPPYFQKSPGKGGIYEHYDAEGMPGSQYILRERDLFGRTKDYGPFDSQSHGEEISSRYGEPLVGVDVPTISEAPHFTAPKHEATFASTSYPSGDTLVAEVSEPGLQVVCDAILGASSISSLSGVDGHFGGEAYPIWRIEESPLHCAGLAFFVPKLTSPHASYESVVLRANPEHEAPPILGASHEVFVGETPESWTKVVQRQALNANTFVDMGSADPGRYFSGFLSNAVEIALLFPEELWGEEVDIELEIREASALTAPDELRFKLNHADDIREELLGDVWDSYRFEHLIAGDEELSISLTGNGDLQNFAFLGEAFAHYTSSLTLEDSPLEFRADATLSFVDIQHTTQERIYAFAHGESGLESLGLQRGETHLRVILNESTTNDVSIVKDSHFRYPTLRSAQNIDSTMVENVEHLIIAPATLHTTLLPLVEHRRAQGLEAQVVSWEQLFDDYSASNFDPAAIESVLSVASSLRYLLLVGQMSYDPHNRSGTAQQADAPFATTYMQTLAHRAFGDQALLGSARHRVSIGRLPSSEPSSIENYAQKVLRYENGLDDKEPGVFLSLAGKTEAGDPNFWAMQDGSRGRTNLEHYVLDLNAGDDALSAIQNAEVVHYVGHSDPGGWNQNLSPEHIAALGEAPIVLSAGCLDQFAPGLAEPLGWKLIDQGYDKGAILSMASSSLSQPQEATHFLNTVIQNLHGERFGDGMMAAQQGIGSDTASAMMLFGDPGLRITLAARNSSTQSRLSEDELEEDKPSLPSAEDTQAGGSTAQARPPKTSEGCQQHGGELFGVWALGIYGLAFRRRRRKLRN